MEGKRDGDLEKGVCENKTVMRKRAEDCWTGRGHGEAREKEGK